PEWDTGGYGTGTAATDQYGYGEAGDGAQYGQDEQEWDENAGYYDEKGQWVDGWGEDGYNYDDGSGAGEEYYDDGSGQYYDDGSGAVAAAGPSVLNFVDERNPAEPDQKDLEFMGAALFDKIERDAHNLQYGLFGESNPNPDAAFGTLIERELGEPGRRGGR
ncbi:unnamed protein product, partial [Amoebophrya sp. A25]